MAGKKHFDPFQIHAVQTSFFAPPGMNSSYTQNPYPPINNTKAEIDSIIADSTNEGRLGVDWEFDPRRGPYILGAAVRGRCGAIPWDAAVARRIVEVAANGVKLVGHSVYGADKPELEQALGIVTPIHWWTDTLVRAYLANQDFAKSPDREEDDDGGGSQGLLNLWTIASLYTNLPAWKLHRGMGCFGPCYQCAKNSYCAIDAWAGLAIDYALDGELRRRGIPESTFTRISTLTHICELMQEQGIYVDRKRVAEFDKNDAAEKELLFPFETIKKKKKYLGAFNPAASKQVIEYFLEHKIELKASDLKEITTALKRKAKDRGLSIDDLENTSESDLGEPLTNLYKLYKYKTSGKGSKSWFSPDYFQYKGRSSKFIHPRFMASGTSLGRLASAKPNCQNLSKHSLHGKKLRYCIVPRQENLCFVESDYGQLEFRICLYYAGMAAPNRIFEWLIEQKPEEFALASKEMGKPPRDTAKSITHAANYGEGFLALTHWELASERRRKERDAGALLVFDGRDSERPLWEYCGRVVCFTGANLADRFFGDRSVDSRRRALLIQEAYMSSDSGKAIRKWHRTITDQIERTSAVYSPLTGRYLAMEGTLEDNFKIGAAFYGQGGGADFVQEHMVDHYEACGEIPLLQIHDSILNERPRDWSDKQCKDSHAFMLEPSKLFDGLVVPIETLRGNNFSPFGPTPKEPRWVNPEGMREI